MTGSLDLLGRELTLAEAAEAARRGDFDAAVRLLEQAGAVGFGGGGLTRGGRGDSAGDGSCGGARVGSGDSEAGNTRGAERSGTKGDGSSGAERSGRGDLGGQGGRGGTKGDGSSATDRSGRSDHGDRSGRGDLGGQGSRGGTKGTSSSNTGHGDRRGPGSRAGQGGSDDRGDSRGAGQGGRGGPEGDIATTSAPRDGRAAPAGGTDPWPTGGEPARLDLLARVYAQAGNLDAADAAWARVLELVPDAPSAMAGRQRVARVRSVWGRRRRVPWRALAVGAAVIVVAGGVVVVTVPFGSAPAVVSGSAAGAAPNGPAASSLQAELDRLNAAKFRDAAAAAARRERLAALATALAAPGVHTSPGETDVSVSFDAGLFGPNATSPSTEGRRALQQWAEVLKGQSVRVTVLGHGVTVAGGPATGGSTVALARATSAARVLATASGLPLTAFAMGSADQSTAAHPDGDPGANRTVTLLVMPA
ncbi:hypothetical protein [Amycolatopsis saalfeldensis]|uniref:OmpA family protein n=1 Tax=Amycolatopsis saalfeldensis TaxID=394193 RepID=A0A1H8RAW8_9PSEU|nr:hypothetical protein [Amycolatopsis saalfeldensis]SEO63427.1 hypothetical protein SAMN04489732_101702 [Amycolatopsis saalfeldensis]